MAEVELYKYIDTLNISEGWKKTFKLIHLVYHRNYYDGNFRSPYSWTSLPEVSGLEWNEKTKFFCTFNFLALIFGPFYYLAKGMFKKGIIMLIIIWLLHAFGNVTSCFIPLIMIHCAIFANVDYFVYKILGSKKIQEDPIILEDSFSTDHYNDVIDGKNTKLPIALCAIFVCIFIIIKMGFNYTDAYINTQALNKVPAICKDDCQQKLGEYMGKLSSTKGKKNVIEYKIACIYTIMRDQKNALKYVDESIKHSARYAPAFILRAMIYTDMGQFQQSIDNYNAALRVDRKLIGLHYNIGRCQYKMKSYAQALMSFKLATKRYPFNASYFEMQGYTKVYMKDIAGAKKDLKRSATLYSLNLISPDKNRTDAVKRYIDVL